MVNARYYKKVEIPISVILETIFNTDNHDVETLSRWAEKYGYVDFIEKGGKKYYKLQDDYEKQSFYVWLDIKEREQYEYENYLLDRLELSDLESDRLETLVDTSKKEKEKAIDKIQDIIDLGFDYDGLNQVDSLKGLIDDLVKIAKEAREILKGDSDENGI